MNAHSGITAALDADTHALVERIAADRGMTTADYAAEAIRRVAESDADFRNFVQAGIDSADRGELTPQDVVFARLRERRQQRRLA